MGTNGVLVHHLLLFHCSLCGEDYAAEHGKLVKTTAVMEHLARPSRTNALPVRVAKNTLLNAWPVTKPENIPPPLPLPPRPPGMK